MNGELFDPPGIVHSVDALAELAGRINAEHHQVETALRAGLQHAKNAGDLLIEAKSQCQHGEWLAWLEKSVRFSVRTVQRYMEIASRWEELANTTHVSHLSFRDALQVLAQPCEEEEESNPQPAADVPAVITQARSKQPTAQPPEREPGSDDDEFDTRDEQRDQKRREASAPTPQKVDAIGQAIPTCQKDVFGDPLLPEKIAWLQEVQGEAERSLEQIRRKLRHYPFVNDIGTHLDDAILALQCARESLTAGTPYAVCSGCKGQGCTRCRNAGHLPQWRYEELKEQEGAA